MGDKNDDLENESILYEVLEYLVRKQEPELTVNFIIITFKAQHFHTFIKKLSKF